MKRWLLLALLVLATQPVDAAIIITPPGVTCAADTRLTVPVAGQDVCFDATRGEWFSWQGVWTQISVKSGVRSVLDSGQIGQADDTAVVQAALTALQATGGTLVVPCNTTININRGRLTYKSLLPVALVGCGWSSKFQWTPATDSPAQNKGMLNIFGNGDADASHVAQVVIRDLAFDFGGARTDSYNGDQRGLNIYNADNVFIVHNSFKGARGEMVGLGNFGSPTTPGNRAWISGNLFTDSAQAALNPNVFDTTVTANTFRRGVVGIEAGRDFFIATSNVFSDFTGPCITPGANRSIEISNNRLIDCATTNTGGVVGAINLAGNGASTPVADGVIQGNVIILVSSSTHNNQIGIQSTRGTSSSDNTRLQISHNTIVGIRFGIYLNSLTSSTITGNRLIGVGGGGVGITILSLSAQVQQNAIYDNHVAGYGTTQIEHSAPVSDNNVVGRNFIGAPAVEQYGPNAGSGATGTLLKSGGGVEVLNTTSTVSSQTAKQTLLSRALQANTLFVNGRCVRIKGWGTAKATANNKTQTIDFGATTVASTGAVANNGGVWVVTALVCRTSSGNQTAIGEAMSATTPALTFTTPAETDTAAITVALTSTNVTDTNGTTAKGLLIEIINQ